MVRCSTVCGSLLMLLGLISVMVVIWLGMVVSIVPWTVICLQFLNLFRFLTIKLFTRIFVEYSLDNSNVSFEHSEKSFVFTNSLMLHHSSRV